jgi:uncharacterized protein YecE (DUF72 family)
LTSVRQYNCPRPAGLKPRDFLAFYATKFNTVEIDSTFDRTPSRSTVTAWAYKTPEGFPIAAKVPQTTTHEKGLVDCEDDFGNFVGTMDLLGDDKLGPLLLQFTYFYKESFKAGEEFLTRLRLLLAKLPKGYRFTAEIRNKNWLNERSADVLRKHNVALALQDQLWMPLPARMKFDCITADFTYVRLLGNRKGTERDEGVGQGDRKSLERIEELG